MSKDHPTSPGVQHLVLNGHDLKESIHVAEGQRRTQRKFSAKFKARRIGAGAVRRQTGRRSRMGPGCL